MSPLILQADHLIPMTGDNAVLSNGAVLVGADGRIAAVGQAPALLAAHPGCR